MGSKKKIGSIEPRGEIYKCPSCAYNDGFHVSFKWNSKETEAEVYLICPSCHTRFYLGWEISSAQSKTRKK